MGDSERRLSEYVGDTVLCFVRASQYVRNSDVSQLP